MASQASGAEGLSLQGFGARLPSLAGMSDDDTIRMAKAANDLGPLSPAVKEGVAKVGSLRRNAQEVDAGVARLQARLADGSLTREQREMIDRQIADGKEISRDLRNKAVV